MPRLLLWLLILLLGGIAFLAILALLLWWFIRRPPEDVTVAEAQPEAPPAPEFEAPPAVTAEPTPIVEPEPPPAPAEPPEPDDLKVIEGIGPKISSVFQAAGITTFAQLAAQEPSDLKVILVEAGIRLGDPTTWPEQAGLAAAGKWDELEALQASLTGGRRT
jgi:predicted flap endonuclease-1-like 5' DNA nuclease